MAVGSEAPPLEEELEEEFSLFEPPLPPFEFEPELVVVEEEEVRVAVLDFIDRERVELPVELAELVGWEETMALVALLVAAAPTGMRYVWTAVGKLLNQPGVSPAENSEASWEETAGELVNASWTSEDGSAVWRTEMTEALSMRSAFVGKTLLRTVSTYSSASPWPWPWFCAATVAARAVTARVLYCILLEYPVVARVVS